MMSGPIHRLRGTCLVTLTLLGGLLASPARAADFDKLDVPSLKEIPADAAYYSAMLRNKEQLNLVLNSKAWKKLVALPGVQDLIQKVNQKIDDPDGPGEQFKKFMEDPDNKEMVELFGDMASREIYFYVGANSSDFAQLMTEMIAAARYGPALIQATGNPRGLSQEEMYQESLFRVAARNPELIHTPDMVIGFRLGDDQGKSVERAEKQLKRLEALLQLAAAFQPNLKGRVKRTKIADGDFITLNLDGSLVPVDDLMAPFKKMEEKEGEFDALVKKLKEMKVTIGIGVRKGYLLIVVGDSLKHLEKLGGKGPNLLTRAEFKPLAKYADKRLTGIDYLSKSLHSKVAPNKNDLKNYLELANAWMAQANLTADQKTRLKKDLASLAKDVEAYVPEAGAMLNFNFLTERGKEGFAYDWSQNLTADGSKPLTLLDHVGGDPVLAVVGRTKTSPDEYSKLVRWVKMGHGWFEELALPKLDDEQKDHYEKAFKAMKPLLKRLDEATGKMLVPAMQDGQMAFVLDAKLSSKQWFDKMPAADKPLPILEPAFIFGITDPELLTKAMGEYRGIANDFVKELHKIKDDVQEFEIPAPKAIKVKGGTVYTYPLKQEWGIDAKLMPNGAVGAKVAVLSISEDHSVRLLNATPLKVEGGPLADLNKKRMAASYVRWSGMVDMLLPWIDYGMDQVPNFGQFDKDDIQKHVHTVAEVLKVFRSSASSTYEEEGAVVTHSETVIRDIP